MREYLSRFKSRSFEVSDFAPSSFESLNESKLSRLTIWAGASDKTIWGAPSSNHLFRAWHDSVHLRTGYDFSVQGELLTAQVQAEEASRLVGDCFASLVHAEVAGQVLYFARFNEFPLNQRAFIDSCMTQGIDRTLNSGRKF